MRFLAALSSLLLCACTSEILIVDPNQEPGEEKRALFLLVTAEQDGKYACRAQWQESRSNLGSESSSSFPISCGEIEAGKPALLRLVEETSDGDEYELRQGEEWVRISSHRGIHLQIEVRPLAGGKLHCRGFYSKSDDGDCDAILIPYDVIIPAGESVAIWQIRTRRCPKGMAEQKLPSD
ncbi:MAG: hypothetical protein RL095_4200 [Verrucomicrobiota bacterium]|jgi:hypothetical protein